MAASCCRCWYCTSSLNTGHTFPQRHSTDYSASCPKPHHRCDRFCRCTLWWRWAPAILGWPALEKSQPDSFALKRKKKSWGRKFRLILFLKRVKALCIPPRAQSPNARQQYKSFEVPQTSVWNPEGIPGVNRGIWQKCWEGNRHHSLPYPPAKNAYLRCSNGNSTLTSDKLRKNFNKERF